MNTNQQTTPDAPPQPPPSRGLDILARNARPAGFSMGGVGLILLICAFVQGIGAGPSGIAFAVWIGFMALLCAIPGVILVTLPREGRLTVSERIRLLLVAVGGTAGFVTSLLGLVLPFTPAFQKVASGGLSEWSKDPKALVKILAPLVGGLILMFLSLQLVRGLERSRPVFRRLLFGYNAVLGSLVLLIILLLVNILSVVRQPPFSVMSKTFDWTASRQYTLNDSFVKLLASIKQPIHVYAFITPASRDFLGELEQLLENCRNVNPKLTYTFLSRDFNRARIDELRKDYSFPDPDGLLVVYGDKGEKQQTEFVRRTELTSSAGMRGDRAPRFTGENALYKAIDFLSQGKSKPAIYFTQGNGEPSVARTMGGDREGSMATLFERLGEGNYTAKELKYEGKETADELTRRLLDEAAVVVVAGPTRPLPGRLVEGLRAYARGDGKKRGKLMLLFDVVADQDGKMVKTGLESLANENQVHVNDDRVIDLLYQQLGRLGPNPRNFVAMFPSRTDNPIALGFRQPGRTYAFRFDDSRTLTVRSNEAPGANIRAEPLLVIPLNLGCWAETNLKSDPVAMVEAILKSEKALEELEQKVLEKGPLVVAAAVSANKSALPPGHPMMPPQSSPEEQQPLMVVFADASWIDDAHLDGNNWSLFNSCLAWLRERPDTGAKPIDPKEPEFFKPQIPPESGGRLPWMPGVLIVLSILGTGVGVWVVRRRRFQRQRRNPSPQPPPRNGEGE